MRLLGKFFSKNPANYETVLQVARERAKGIQECNHDWKYVGWSLYGASKDPKYICPYMFECQLCNDTELRTSK